MSTCLQSPYGVDRGRSGVATRGADDHHVLVALGEHVLEEPPDELQRDVLERECRPVEQLEQPLVSSIWTSGATAGWPNVAYASWQMRSNTTRSISPSTNGHITAAATSA